MVFTAVVIREPEQASQQQQEETGDEDYSSNKELASEDDISLDDEKYQEQLLENEHRELIHPPIERIEYLPWQVELDDDLQEEMKHFDTQKLKDAFEDKDEGSKQVKCGKVLHLPSLNELVAHEPFFSHMHAVGFEWLLDNGDPNIPIRLANEFFTTFRFMVTTNLDELSISFRVFGREVEMSLVEWTVRLGMCTLEEAISSKWRERERGIPRRYVEFDPQAAW